MKRILRICLVIIIVATMLVLGAIMVFGNRYIFYPAPLTAHDAELRALSAAPIEEVAIVSEDGTKLSAWWMQPPKATAVVLFLHGNGGNVANRIEYLLALQKLPVAVLLLDYRGYGRSEGKPTETGVCQDAQAAYRWLRERGWSEGRIFVYGESLGGAVAIDLASRERVAGLIVQATFTSIGDMARLVVPWVPLGWAISAKFRSADKIENLRVPKLHFHGPQDEVVPYRLGKRLFERAAEPKRWVEYPEMHHNDWPGAREKDWLSELRRFIEENSK